MRQLHLRRLFLVLAVPGSVTCTLAACSDDPSVSTSSSSSSSSSSSGGSNDGGSSRDASSPPDASDAGVPTFVVGGNVSGLPARPDGGVADGGGVDAAAGDAGADAGDGGASPSLILQNNGRDDLTVPGNGPFAFATRIGRGGAYAVTVKNQPIGHTCAVTRDRGSVTADVTDVAVACTRLEYTISAKVTGLTGTNLIVTNNGAGDVTFTADATKPFAMKVKWGDPYSVAVKTAPAPYQRCSVTGGAGIASADTTVNIDCSLPGGSATYAAAKTYTAPATFLSTLMGLAGDGTNFISVSGGGPAGQRLVKVDGMFGFLQGASPGRDFRSVFYVGANLYARSFNSMVIDRLDPATFAPMAQVTLAGTLDSQAAVYPDTASGQLWANQNGTLRRWNFADGAAQANVTLTGFGGMNNENNYPQGVRMVTTRGYVLTYSNGVLSFWDSTTGTRLRTTTLTGAGTGFDSHFGIAYANGLMWVADAAGAATWRGYDIGLD